MASPRFDTRVDRTQAPMPTRELSPYVLPAALLRRSMPITIGADGYRSVGFTAGLDREYEVQKCAHRYAAGRTKLSMFDG